MNVVIIYGSYRQQRLGIRAALYTVQAIKERGHTVHLVDAMQYQLPWLDKMYKEYDPGMAPEAMEELHHLLDQADGFVIVTGEYNHSIPPGLKNLLDTFQSEYYFKPSAIVSYSVGSFGGVRVADHLRAVLAELGMPAIPSSLPIPRVHQVFDENGTLIDQAYTRRFERFLSEFEWYMQALATQRKQGTPY